MSEEDVNKLIEKYKITEIILNGEPLCIKTNEVIQNKDNIIK